MNGTRILPPAPWALAIAATLAVAGTRPAHDVAVKLKVKDAATAGPLATLTLRNQGTVDQGGVEVTVYAENENGGLVLWSGTADLPAGRSTKIRRRIWLDQDTTVLVARAGLDGAADEDPDDDAARAGLGFRGKRALALVGRSIHLAVCASCHGEDAKGGPAPSIAGASSRAIRSAAAAGGDHAFPWLSGKDAKGLSVFLRDPAGTVLPPPLPAPPAGGWPGFAADVSPIYSLHCVRCHGPSLANARVRLDTYEGAVKSAKRALFEVKAGTMPRGGARLDPLDVQAIQDWITGGYRE